GGEVRSDDGDRPSRRTPVRRYPTDGGGPWSVGIGEAVRRPIDRADLTVDGDPDVNKCLAPGHHRLKLSVVEDGHGVRSRNGGSKVNRRRAETESRAEDHDRRTARP